MARKQRPLGTAAIYGAKMSHAVEIMLPDYMFEWVERKIGNGECRSRGEVVRRLIEDRMEWQRNLRGWKEAIEEPSGTVRGNRKVEKGESR